MTNPDNIVRVRARRGGRASVYEANGWCQAFSQGVLDGVGVIPNTVPDLNVLVGGTPTCPDVIIATNPAGYKIALDIVGQEAITLTAPASNSRVSAIVAYTDDLALSTTENEVTGSPATCGLIVVNGPTSANPVPPSDTEIRAAITEDGAAGSQACYAIVATVTVSASTALITDSLISVNNATIMSHNVNFEAFPTFMFTNKQEAANVWTEQAVGKWVDGKTIYRKMIKSNGVLGDSDLKTSIGTYMLASTVNEILPMSCAMLARSDHKDWETVGVWTSGAGWMLGFEQGSDKGLYAIITRSRLDSWTDRQATVVMYYTKTTD